VLDGAAGALRKVASTSYTAQAEGNIDFGGILAHTALVPGSPAFSHDGRWLAYLVPHGAGDGAFSQLWIADGDGTAAHLVSRLAVDQLVGWSPSADVLAVTTDTRTAPVYDPAMGAKLRSDEATVLQLVTPGGVTRRLLAVPAIVHGPQIYDAVWSPNGTAIAVATYEGFPSPLSTVRAYPIAGGTPTTWLVIRARQGLPGVCTAACGGVTADLAGWWRGWGIAFWALPGALAQTVDATALVVLASPGATPHVIARTLANGTTDEIATAPDGAVALVASTRGSGRVYTQGKAVETCALRTRTCAELPEDTVWSGATPRFPCPSPCSQFHQPPPGVPGSAVSLDPAWSTNGSQLAYVEAPSTPTGENPTPAWYGAHELFLWNSRTDMTRKLADISGVTVPTWSNDGKQLLYVSGDGLWLAPLVSGRPVEIEHPLFPEQEWRTVATNQLSFYGQIAWTAHFSWSSP
jgi:WD40 repeat protein